ncbi:hypothetical protein DD556_07900 [Phaeobacter sp. JL2872]|nr:hypothetical protein DD556_07900 [Phaeobacter sp. JL2872]
MADLTGAQAGFELLLADSPHQAYMPFTTAARWALVQGSTGIFNGPRARFFVSERQLEPE